MVEVYKTGLVEFPDLNLDKPVYFSEDTLKEIASSTGTINLTKAHSNENIAELENFVYDNGSLYADTPKGLDLKGFGISPLFDMDYQDAGDYYVPVNVKMVEAGLVTNPRNSKVYNSKGDEPMADDKILDSLNQANGELAKMRAENDRLKNENKKLADTSKSFEELQADLEAKKEEIDKLLKENEAIKPQAEKFADFEAKRKQELIESITKDEETQKVLEKESLETLQFYKEKKLFDTKPRGVGEGQAPGLDDGSELSEEQRKKLQEQQDSDKLTIEEYDAWKQANSSW